MQKTKLFMPYINDNDYLEQIKSEPDKDNLIIFGRYRHDYQDNCVLFNNSKHNAMTPEDVRKLKMSGFNICYVYDVFDFENREFTVDGYKALNHDINRIIKDGFTHILVSNPYLIEILCNEYKHKIKLVISSQLEINSVQGLLFFDVLNDISAISHVVLSQNHLNKSRFNELQLEFSKRNINVVVELYRPASNNQIIHEHYYNVLYGYVTKNAKEYVDKYFNKNQEYFKSTRDMYYKSQWFKIGDVNSSAENIVKRRNFVCSINN